jgi:hypothetical protein
MERRKNHNKLRSLTATVLAATAIAGCSEVASTTSTENIRPAAVELAPAPIHIETPVAAAPLDITPKLQADLAEMLKDYTGEIQIAVRDRNTGHIYQYTNMPNPEQTINTASTVKLSILEAMLLQNQENNLAFVTCPDHPEIPMPVQMSCEQLTHAIPMIEESSDDDASALWTQIGGPTTLQNFYNQIGSGATIADPNGQWGWSQSTAVDQLNVVDQLNSPASLLTPSSKAVANFLLHSVVPEQRWGVGGGSVNPAEFVNKNGWMPTSQHRQSWTNNSIGNVNDGTNINYDLAMYSDNNGPGDDGYAYGVATLNSVSSIIRSDMAAATITLRPAIGGGR